MSKSRGIFKNPTIVKSVIDLFRAGGEFTASDVANRVNVPNVPLSEGQVHRVLLMLLSRGVLKRRYVEYNKRARIRLYHYTLFDRSVLFDLEV